MPGTARRALRGSFLLLLAAALPLGAQQRPTLTPADYGRFENLGAGTLSPDGRWLAVQISRVDADGELQIYNTATGEKRVVANGVNARFSADGRWLAYGIGVPQRERERLERARQPVRSKVGVVDLRTGAERITDNIASFEFSGDGRFLALRGYAPAAPAAPAGATSGGAAAGSGAAAGAAASRNGRGVNVLIRDLANGTDTNFGNVAELGWQSNGSLLALAIDADNRIGNGVQLFDAGRGVLRTLTSDTAVFNGIVWRKDADDLAVRREIKDEGRDNESHVIHAWTGLAGRAPRMHTFDPTARADFPQETRVVSYRALSWSDDGGTLFLGIREWPAKAARDTTPEGDRVGVEIWHARDVDVIPEQRVRAEMNRRRNALAAWHLPNNRFVEIASDPDLNVTLARGQRLALGLDGRPYDRERMFGPAYSDLYTIDVATGERRLVQQRIQFQYGASPGGRYALYVRDNHFWAYDVNRGTHTNLTANVPASFINVDNDHTIVEKPPFGVAGWTNGDRSVLIYDRFDVWEVRADGSGASRLTDGAAEQLRHRIVRLDVEDPVIDLSKPTYLSLYGERSKQFGYARLARGGTQRLVLLDSNVSRLAKADKADVFVYVTQTFHESPNYHVAGPTLANARQLTDTNPFLGEYAWSPRSELIDFTNARGQPLQAALHYPANYDPSRQYPMIVYYYEITSNTIHNFVTPSERSGYNPAVWTQEGYFVLRPDITYRDRNPGISAVESVVPAVDATIARVNVDPARVGITGHSWGGYQTAFLATAASDRFAAAVAGAPLTEMYGMYLSMYWNTGGTDARIFEISQGRMQVPPWEDLDSYMANSPVHQIRNMRTPLLVAFGDKDGAVDWQQGIMMYNAARREDKDFVLLVYPGENHSLARRPNQIDYHRRSLEWFGHYLKGEPAPAWMIDGVRHGTPDLRPPRATPVATTNTTTNND